MTIRKGEPWGTTGSRLPAGAPVARSDADVSAVVEAARRSGERPGPVGVLAGDLCRTLGGPGDERRLHTSDAVTFTIDVGEVLLDGRLRLFVAHLVVRNRWWTEAFVAMNAQWRGGWNLGPRAHPNDGRLDTYEAHLRPSDVAKVRRRLPAGAHLPHPRIRERRVAALQMEFDRPRPVEVDGVPAGRVRTLSLRVEPDALTVVI